MAPELLFNRYDILELISSGRYSEVHRAFDTRMEREVAIKKIRRDDEPTPRAIREAKTVALLNHPNIVTLYELEEDKNYYYLIMEYIEGIKLSDLLLENEALDIDSALAIAIQVCHGLENAHLNQIIHRDIKPQNLMILPDGRVKIMDFGLALLTAQNDINKNQTIAGTPAYMSPEQAKGSYIDVTTDIYSLGAVLYRLVSGSLPFEGNSIKSVLLKIQNSEPIPAERINPELPEDLANLIKKAMLKNPADRFQTATDFRYKLERCLNEKSSPQDILADLYEEISEIYAGSKQNLGLGFNLPFSSFKSISNSNFELVTRLISSIVIMAAVYISWPASLSAVTTFQAILTLIIGIISIFAPIIGVGLMWLLLAIAAFYESISLGIFLLFTFILYMLLYGRHHPKRTLWLLLVYPLNLLNIIFLYPLIIGYVGGWITALVLSLGGFFFWESLLLFSDYTGFIKMSNWMPAEFVNNLSSSVNPLFLPLALISNLFKYPFLFFYLLLFMMTALIGNLFSGNQTKRKVFISYLISSIILISGSLAISNVYTNIVFIEMMKSISISLIIGFLLILLFPFWGKSDKKRFLEDTDEYIGNEYI